MIRAKKRDIAIVTVVLTFLTGCGDFGNEGENSALNFRDVKILEVSKEPLIEINASTVQNILAGSINANLAPTDPNYKVAFGIKSYKIIYSTKDDNNNDINGSGLITIPLPTEVLLNSLKERGKSYSMSIISDQHGTIFNDLEAPSRSIGGLQAFMGAILQNQPPQGTPVPFLMSAIGGFITVQPDYIGYGASKGLHPYLLEKSSAKSTIDMIKAAMKFANDNSLPFNGQLFLSGYSEGGYVTLAAAKEIEKSHPFINLMGIAPMAGPYDLNMTAMGIIAKDSIDRVDFVGGILNAYSSIYENIELSSIVNEPYATTIPTLYTGDISSPDIIAELESNTSKLFIPSYRYDFLTNPNNSLKERFIENTPLDWSPKTKVNLLHCSNDDVISSQLSQVAEARLKANGSTTVELNLIDSVPDSALPSVHVACAPEIYKRAVEWFSKIRTGEIK